MSLLSLTQWYGHETSPVGLRHLTVAPAFQKTILDSSGFLDFGSLNVNPSGSKTVVFTFKVDSVSQINNMRFWMPTSGGLSYLNTDWILGYINSGVWIQNYDPARSILKSISSTLPTSNNVFRQDGENTLGSGVHGAEFILPADEDTSQFIYVKLLFGPGARIANYNTGASGNLEFRITYESADF